ncbi:uncharacterized protein LOC124812109 [Hydra vulgaris]|uniref:uncharacterized protein LOC124812109 n=1 Tax=Hydra vulgaris TaxID=6087 RepID=UPI001F5EF830|nr:uncharacterized protein LOC124812109 [Hydra vulgaris]
MELGSDQEVVKQYKKRRLIDSDSEDEEGIRIKKKRKGSDCGNDSRVERLDERQEMVLKEYDQKKRSDWYVTRSTKYRRSVYLAIALIGKRMIISTNPINSKDWKICFQENGEK